MHKHGAITRGHAAAAGDRLSWPLGRGFAATIHTGYLAWASAAGARICSCQRIRSRAAPCHGGSESTDSRALLWGTPRQPAVRGRGPSFLPRAEEEGSQHSVSAGHLGGALGSCQRSAAHCSRPAPVPCPPRAPAVLHKWCITSRQEAIMAPFSSPWGGPWQATPLRPEPCMTDCTSRVPLMMVSGRLPRSEQKTPVTANSSLIQVPQLGAPSLPSQDVWGKRRQLRVSARFPQPSWLRADVSLLRGPGPASIRLPPARLRHSPARSQA